MNENKASFRKETILILQAQVKAILLMPNLKPIAEIKFTDKVLTLLTIAGIRQLFGTL